ncbi:MAG TPA: hypothetical protein VJT09_18560 [Pyrinomonadaceae bacterium]|nr:hypothetical protein [Pyrinomonadaceae bacterium]
MPQTNTKPTKIMIIRHAEKPAQPPPPNGVDIDGCQNKDSLIPQGWQRAGALATLFAPSRGPLQDPNLATPKYIYATKSPDPQEGNRPEQTVTPLAAKLQMKPNFSFKKGKEEKVVESALCCDGVVLISWPHGRIPTLAGYIPLSPKSQPLPKGKWPGNRFDMVWVFDYDTRSRKGGYIFCQVPQLLLAGDSSEPIT